MAKAYKELELSKEGAKSLMDGWNDGVLPKKKKPVALGQAAMKSAKGSAKGKKK